MFRSIQFVSVVASMLIAATAAAQAPSGAPAGSTGLCKDGTYSSAATKKGACSGHKGVQDWYGTASASTGAAAPAAPPAAAPAAPAPAAAQAPSGTPAGSTGLCKDGTYSSAATKKGACSGHKGVQDWYGTASASTGATATATPAAMPAAPAASAPKAAPAPAMTPAPGGGAGQVWVNTSTKVYHCPSDPWYGKTKSGAYMSEADAIAKGNHPDHGKACNK